MDSLVNHPKHTVVIEKVLFGGEGLARLPDGLVVMVPHVLPGERVEVEEVARKKSFVQARLLAVLEPSSKRVEPQCPHFPQCGGCQLHHARYDLQTEIKKEFLGEILARNYDTLAATDYVHEEFIASDTLVGYRQRVRLQVDDRGRLGFFGARSHTVAEIGTCLLAIPQINDVLQEIRRYDEVLELLLHAQEVELVFSPLDEMVIVVVELTRMPRAADQRAASLITGRIGKVKSTWLKPKEGALTGPFGVSGTEREEFDAERVLLSLPQSIVGHSINFCLEPVGFCQVNILQNEKLIRLMLDWAGDLRESRVLDLFCGMGNFSLPLAYAAQEVFGTDVQRSAIRCAKLNARHNKIANCHFSREDALEAARVLAQDKKIFDLVLLDPPRQGCKEIIPYLNTICRSRLIYISCDPATLIRDLCSLHAVGFKLKRICGLDMFPQTYHLETIALLEKVA